MLKKVLKIFLLVLMCSVNVNAQYSKSHYIAPSPWQYWSNANEIVLTTESVTEVTVYIYKSDKTLITTQKVTSSAPTVYRFSGNPIDKKSHSINAIMKDAGLIIESQGGKVSVNLRNVASDKITGGNGSTIKGNASLVSFGNEGRGTSFRLGYYRKNFGGIAGFNGAANSPVYSVMAIDDNTQISVNGTLLVELNKGESYLFQRTSTGDLLEATKPVVANTGAYTDSPGGCGDGAVDQMAPVSILGKNYVVVRGSGTAGENLDNPEQTTFIATQDNTNVTVSNFNASGVFLINRTYILKKGGDFESIFHGDALNKYSSSVIKSDKPIAVYSGTAQSCEVDIATVLPVGGCSGSKWTSTSAFTDYNSNNLPYFGFILLSSKTEPIYVNGKNIETDFGKTRFQIGTTGNYLVSFENADIGNPSTITVNSNARLNVGIVQQGGGFSMSGYFSSFNETPELPEVKKNNDGCAMSVITADAGLEPYQWYLDGVLLPGEVSQSIVPIKTGNYSITGTRDCGVTGQSAAIYVVVCSDRQVIKTVTNGASKNEVEFMITAKNNGLNADKNVEVTDDLPSGYNFISATASKGAYDITNGRWIIGNLNAGEVVTLKINATVKNSGEVTNTAKISGDNLDIIPTNDIASVTPFSELQLVKKAATGTYNKAGNVIDYTFELTNTGKVPLFNVNITDANADLGSILPTTIATLLPGELINGSAQHTITNADLIAGKVINTALAKGVDGNNNSVSDISGTAGGNDTPTETITKSVIFADNDTSVVNGITGKINSLNIFANDNLNGLAIDPKLVVVTINSVMPAELILQADGSVDVAPGTASGTYTFDYTVCELAVPNNCSKATVTIDVINLEALNDISDPIDGRIETIVPSIYANDTLDGKPVVASEVKTTLGVPLPSGLVLNIDGTITVQAGTAAGIYNIPYTICDIKKPSICADAVATVNVFTIEALDDKPNPIDGTQGGLMPSIFINDKLDGQPIIPSTVLLTTADPLPSGLTLNPDGTIKVDPGTLPGTYDINYSICQIANPKFCAVAKTSVVVKVASIKIIKEGVLNDLNQDGITQVGETVTYKFTVLNTGSASLHNIMVTDPIVVVTGGPIPLLDVAEKDTQTFSALYVLTQQDINAGKVINQAEVKANSEFGNQITIVSDSNDPTLTGEYDPTVVPLIQQPNLILEKVGYYKDANKDGTVNLGDEIVYSFKVSNTGNVTMKDIIVTDPMVKVSGAMIASLNPMEEDATTFTAVYTLTQSDINRGAVYNIAEITAKDPFNVPYNSYSDDPNLLTPQDEFYDPTCSTCTVTKIQQNSSIAIIKTAVFNDENANGNAEVGETIEYQFTIKNTGNVVLNDILVHDPLPGVIMTGGPISLLPGESNSVAFKGIYPLTQKDIITGKVVNQAVVTGVNPLGLKVTDISDDLDVYGDNPTVLAIEGCKIKIANAMSINGDGINERFYIQGIDCYTDNSIEIYNRWGVLVFERTQYNNEERAFRGFSDGRTTVKQSEGLPSGTYYYILKYKDALATSHQKAGYLYLTK